MGTFTATSASTGYRFDLLTSHQVEKLSVLSLESTKVVFALGGGPTGTGIGFGGTATYFGSDFTWSGTTLTGTLTDYAYHLSTFDMAFTDLPPIPVTDFLALEGRSELAFRLFVTTGNDLASGAAAADILDFGEGADTIYGGAGNDTIEGGLGADYLRGEDGDDYMIGGDEFDDMLGNKGRDTLYGAEGNDWVVGGQDNDLLFGENGKDIVYGNMGADTVSGGAGDDWVRGGQGDDTVLGGAGDDFLAGDRGDDILTGGTGADLFYTFGDTGRDTVTDFNRAAGDRVQIEVGTTWTVAQTGADVVISMSGGGTMVLVGVQHANLAGDWIGYA